MLGNVLWFAAGVVLGTEPKPRPKPNAGTLTFVSGEWEHEQ